MSLVETDSTNEVGLLESLYGMSFEVDSDEPPLDETVDESLLDAYPLDKTILDGTVGAALDAIFDRSHVDDGPLYMKDLMQDLLLLQL